MSELFDFGNSARRLLETSRELPITDRLALAQAIWDTVPPPPDWKPSPATLAEVRRRKDEFDRDPSVAISQDEMNARLDALRLTLKKDN